MKYFKEAHYNYNNWNIIEQLNILLHASMTHDNVKKQWFLPFKNPLELRKERGKVFK